MFTVLNPVNRCSQYFDAGKLHYFPYLHCDIENKLKALEGKHIVVEHISHKQNNPIKKEGILVRFICERIENSQTGIHSNEVILYLKGKNEYSLILLDEEDTSSWIGTVDEYNRLDRKNYFNDLRAERVET